MTARPHHGQPQHPGRTGASPAGRRVSVRATPLAVLMAVAGLALLLAGCRGNAAMDSERALPSVAERLVTSALALRMPDAPEATATPAANPRGVGSNATIGNTGGTGVSLRSDCLDAARSGGGWADGTALVVAAVGTDRCAEWTRVTAAAVSSWVRNEYLVAGSGPAQPAPGASAPRTLDDLRPAVASLHETTWRVAALLRSTPGRGDDALTATYLGMAASEATKLKASVQAAPAGSCPPARERLLSAAGELETLAKAAQRMFEAPGGDAASSVERGAEVFISAQVALTGAIGGCLSA